jgi:hypothetical protein
VDGADRRLSLEVDRDLSPVCRDAGFYRRAYPDCDQQLDGAHRSSGRDQRQHRPRGEPQARALAVNFYALHGHEIQSTAQRLSLGRFRTDAAGRFTVAGWRPAKVGIYQLTAHISHPGGDLLPDSACGATVWVDR